MIAAFLIAAVAAPQAGSGGPAMIADVRCVAALSVGLSRATPEQQRMLGGGIMYFVGKIEGRRPGYDLMAGLLGIAPDSAALQRIYVADIKRCGAELAVRGQALRRLGDVMKGSGAGK